MNRNEHIADERRKGRTLKSIAEDHGVTRERVRQICKRAGAFPSQCTTQHKSKKVKRLEDKERKCWDKWGIDLETYSQLRAMSQDWGNTPMGRYSAQKKNAERRGIEWNITFAEWWDIWERSGRWQDRGVSRNQCVMARRLDAGAYEFGNVRIVTTGENMREYAHESRKRKNPPARYAWDRVPPIYEDLLNREVFVSPDSQWD